jgi:DNA-binding transcriptional MocR family regulator
MLCTVLTTPGDVVIVEEPTYFLAFQMFRDHGLEIRGVSIDGEGLVVEAFTEAVAAANENDVLIVADEVYHLLRFAPGEMPPPMSAYVDDGPILSIGTFSKILAPGMRLGWIHGSLPRLAALADSGLILSGGGLNPLTSSLSTAMMRMGWQDEYVEWLRATFARRSATMVAALRRHMPNWVQYDVPSGGYFVWLRLPSGADGAVLRSIAKHHGVDVRHGAQFSPSGGMGNHIRLSYAFYDDADIAEGVARLGAALQTT